MALSSCCFHHHITRTDSDPTFSLCNRSACRLRVMEAPAKGRWRKSGMLKRVLLRESINCIDHTNVSISCEQQLNGRITAGQHVCHDIGWWCVASGKRCAGYHVDDDWRTFSCKRRRACNHYDEYRGIDVGIKSPVRIPGYRL